MSFENNSVLYKKAFDFSLNVINIYKDLNFNKKEFVISKQLLRSGTSIGANISESFHSQSPKDNINKLYIALKEAGETEYWLKLLFASNMLKESDSQTLFHDLNEIIKILSSIIKINKKKLVSSTISST